MKIEITKEEATLILQMLAGAKADPSASDYIEICTTIKSLHDKCVAVVNAKDEKATAKSA